MFWFLLWKSGLLLHIQLQADSTLSRLHYINSHLFNPSPPPKGFWIPLHLYPNQLSSFKIHLAIWLLFVCLLIALVRSPFENLSSTPSTDQYICFLSSLCVWQNISVVPELLFESIANDPGLQTRPKWGQQLVNKGLLHRLTMLLLIATWLSDQMHWKQLAVFPGFVTGPGWYYEQWASPLVVLLL